MLARQMLYCLSHTPIPLVLVIFFQTGSHTFAQGHAQTTALLLRLPVHLGLQVCETAPKIFYKI
jgi:hypothetical protein